MVEEEEGGVEEEEEVVDVKSIGLHRSPNGDNSRYYQFHGVGDSVQSSD